VSHVLTLKASVAAAVLAGTALVSAGAGYAISRTTMTAQVAVSCPAPAVTAAPAPPTRSFPPLGNLPATTGGQKF
jgi:hypothetical protein